MKIIWTEFAKIQLRQIFDYYADVASKSIAHKIVKSIFNRTVLLKTHPKIGTIEEHLSDTPYKYRYLIEINYKIIYRISENVIYVTDVFDTHQNPEKIKIRNK